MNELLEHLITKIQVEISVIQEDLAMGKAKDHGEYKQSCGVVRGLITAQNIITEVKERMEKDDE
jgi:hypothetical protein